MNTKEWAKKLNGTEYVEESEEYQDDLIKDDMVVVYISDDNLLLDGAINEEYETYSNIQYFWCADSFVSQDTINEFLDYVDGEYPEFYDFLEKLFTSNEDQSYIQLFSKKDGTISFKTNIPGEWFDITEDDELSCKGFIFKKSDLKGITNP